MPSSLNCLNWGRGWYYAFVFSNRVIFISSAKKRIISSPSPARPVPSPALPEEAVLYVQGQPFQDSSVINSSIISAVKGEYGNHHLTEKTKGSCLRISPLMGQYWFFELSAVAEQNLYLPQIRDTHTFIETVYAFLAVKKVLAVRTNKQTFRL